MERRLAAVMAADVAGYSRLMEQDEANTLARVRALMHEVLEPRIAAGAGRIIKYMGDGLLAEFPSAVNAVDCAMHIQRLVGLREGDRAAEAKTLLRIGINLGDVIVEGGDIFGTGVNVAARLESLADPGGICLSANVFELIDGKLDLDFEDIGSQTVKNLVKPVRVYRAILPDTAAGAPEAMKPPAIHDKPSVAVLPFDDIGGDPERKYFAEGMAADITTSLARCKWLFVIALNSTLQYRAGGGDAFRAGRELGVRYVLEGSVRRSGDKVRTTLRLIDAASAAHLWAERYDRSMTDIFDLQDDIVRSVVAVLEPTLKKAEVERIRRKRPNDLDAYEAYLRALPHMYEIRPEGRALALDFITRALELDPQYAEAHGVAAWCYFARSLWEGSLPALYHDTMLTHVRAVQLSRTDDASTLAHAAIALSLTTRDYQSALVMIDRAIASNPSSAHAYGHGSVINTWAGNYHGSIEMSDLALRLSPFDPLAVMPLAGQAGARLMLGDYTGAAEFAARALTVYPTHTPSLLIGIVSLMRLDRPQQAAAMAQRLMAASPGYRIVPNAPILEHFTRELRQAGLPDLTA